MENENPKAEDVFYPAVQAKQLVASVGKARAIAETLHNINQLPEGEAREMQQKILMFLEPF